MELEAHFRDAVESHLAEGSDEIEAHREALQDLGDADIAAKRLRKHHLTNADAKTIKRLLMYRLSFGLFLFYTIDVTLFVLDWYLPQILPRIYHSPHAFVAAGVFCCALFQTASHFVARSKLTIARVRLLFLLAVLINAGLVLCFASTAFSAWLAIPLAFAAQFIWSVRLLSRLGNFTDLEKELPA